MKKHMTVIEGRLEHISYIIGTKEGRDLMLVESETLYPDDDVKRAIQYGPRRVSACGRMVAETYLAVEGADGHYEIERMSFDEDRNGVMTMDIMKYLREKKGLHCKSSKWNPDLSWQDNLYRGYGMVTENGWCMFRSSSFDGWRQTEVEIMYADGILYQGDRNIFGLSLDMGAGDYDREDARQRILESLAAPHEFSPESLREFVRQYGKEYDLSHWHISGWDKDGKQFYEPALPERGA
jgi:hypothetical protein